MRRPCGVRWEFNSLPNDCRIYVTETDPDLYSSNSNISVYISYFYNIMVNLGEIEVKDPYTRAMFDT